MAAPWAVGDTRIPQEQPGLGPSRSLPVLGSRHPGDARGGKRADRRARSRGGDGGGGAGGDKGRAGIATNRRQRRHEKLRADVPPLRLPAGRDSLSVVDVLDRAKDIRKGWKLQRQGHAFIQRPDSTEPQEERQDERRQQQEPRQHQPSVATQRPDLLEDIVRTQSLLDAVRAEPATLEAYRAHFRQFDATDRQSDKLLTGTNGNVAPNRQVQHRYHREASVLAVEDGVELPQVVAGQPQRLDKDVVLATKLRLRKLSRKQMRLLELEEMLGNLQNSATEIMQRVHETQHEIELIRRWQAEQAGRRQQQGRMAEGGGGAAGHSQASAGRSSMEARYASGRGLDWGRPWKDVPMDLINKAFRQAIDYVVRQHENRDVWHSASSLCELIEREEHPTVAWLSEAFADEREGGQWLELTRKLLRDTAERAKRGTLMLPDGLFLRAAATSPDELHVLFTDQPGGDGCAVPAVAPP